MPMQKGTRFALMLACIPFVTLVLMLPLVNRTDPIVLGLPFLLFWIVLWIFLTPFVLLAAYILQKRFNLPEEEE